MDTDKEVQSTTLLQSGISVSPGEEMLSKAIAITLQTPAQERAELLELLMREIAASVVIALRRVRAVGGLTPGITRRHKTPKVNDRRRVGGRVHAVVRQSVIGTGRVPSLTYD